MAAYFAMSNAIWLQGPMDEVGYPQETPTVIWSDNQSCIAIAKNPTLKSRAKHIDIKYHFLCEWVTSGETTLKYIATQYQVADILAKLLGRSSFEMFREKMGIQIIASQSLMIAFFAYHSQEIIVSSIAGKSIISG